MQPSHPRICSGKSGLIHAIRYYTSFATLECWTDLAIVWGLQLGAGTAVGLYSAACCAATAWRVGVALSASLDALNMEGMSQADYADLLQRLSSQIPNATVEGSVDALFSQHSGNHTTGDVSEVGTAAETLGSGAAPGSASREVFFVGLFAFWRFTDVSFSVRRRYVGGGSERVMPWPDEESKCVFVLQDLISKCARY